MVRSALLEQLQSVKKKVRSMRGKSFTDKGEADAAMGDDQTDRDSADDPSESSANSAEEKRESKAAPAGNKSGGGSDGLSESMREDAKSFFQKRKPMKGGKSKSIVVMPKGVGGMKK